MKILLVDDHHLFRKTLSMLISTFEEITVVEEAANGLEALSILATKNIDMVFLDVCMPVMDGFDCYDKILIKYPETKVVILTEIESKAVILHFIQVGVKSFLTKNTYPAEIQTTIREVMKGDCYFPEAIMSTIKNSLSYPKNHNPLSISEKEKTVLSFLESGLSSKEVAQHMKLSTKTVNNYREHLLEKTDSKNVAELISWGYKNGILSYVTQALPNR